MRMGNKRLCYLALLPRGEEMTEEAAGDVPDVLSKQEPLHPVGDEEVLHPVIRKQSKDGMIVDRPRESRLSQVAVFQPFLTWNGSSEVYAASVAWVLSPF